MDSEALSPIDNEVNVVVPFGCITAPSASLTVREPPPNADVVVMTWLALSTEKHPSNVMGPYIMVEFIAGESGLKETSPTPEIGNDMNLPCGPLRKTTFEPAPPRTTDGRFHVAVTPVQDHLPSKLHGFTPTQRPGETRIVLDGLMAFSFRRTISKPTRLISSPV